MFYGRIKQNLIIKPCSKIKKGLHILFHLGPKAFLTRLKRYVKKQVYPVSSGDYARYVETTALQPRDIKRIKEEGGTVGFRNGNGPTM